MSNSQSIIGITIGDIHGIGPEIILKSLMKTNAGNGAVVLFTPEEVISYYQDLLNLQFSYSVINSPAEIKAGEIHLFADFSLTANIKPGELSASSGMIAMKSIETAIEWACSGKIDGFITAPISKEAVNLAGYQIPGHTEFLAEKTDTDSVVMMLVNEGLRVALVTVHDPIKNVASLISKPLILERLSILNNSLKKDFSIEQPKIAVLGLNPHAGDGGIIGTEETDIITPALSEANASGLKVHGPFPADGFFGQQLHTQYDAILAMYHDQGLAPFKLLSFGKGVNFTAGLPIIRTSPDHGTAFDIAGKGMANPSSFIQAFNLAVELAGKRKANDR